MDGKLITIYGINNIGKSTHCKRLTDKLIAEGYDAVFLKYPVYDCSPTGPKINEILRSHDPQSVSEEELQTLFMQNRKDFEPELNTLLKEGKIVVAEDYTGTGIAWGTAKGLSKAWLEDLNKDLREEDFAILITGQRITRAREEKHIHETNDVLVEKVGKVLNNLAEAHDWHKVVLQDEKDDTAASIWGIVKNFLQNN
ncbi:dTMP kinase [Pseudomonadota bacterium]